MFALELNRRSLEYGWGILSNAAHPGATWTNLQTTGPTLGRASSGVGLGMRITGLIPGFWQEVPQGCLPALFAATSPRAVGGGYYGPLQSLTPRADARGAPHGQDRGPPVAEP